MEVAALAHGGTGAPCQGSGSGVGVPGTRYAQVLVAFAVPSQLSRPETSVTRSNGWSSAFGLIGSAEKAMTRPLPTVRTMAAGASSRKRAKTFAPAGTEANARGSAESTGIVRRSAGRPGARPSGSANSRSPVRRGPRGRR